MKSNRIMTLVTFGFFLSSAALASGGGNRGGNGGGNKGGGNKPVCDGTEPARQGAPYVQNISAAQKLATFQTAMETYELEHPEAAEYSDVSKRLSGLSCFTDDDCATGDDSKYKSNCERYEWEGTNGSCQVHSLIAIPTPPILAKLSCADVSCPASFQCEVEENTGAVGCVEQRSCVVQR